MLSYVRIHQNYSDMQLDKGDGGKIFKEKKLCWYKIFFGKQTKTSSIYGLFPEEEVSFIGIFDDEKISIGKILDKKNFLIWKFSIANPRDDDIFIGKLPNEEDFYR